MKRNEFTPKALAKLVRVGDRNDFPADFAIGLDALLEQASGLILSGEALNVPHQICGPAEKPWVVYQQYHVHLLFRALSRIVRRRFRVSPQGRDVIVKGIIESLSEQSEMYILRRDVASFYESMPYAEVKSRLLFDTAMSRLVRHYLEQFFDKHCGPGGVGLPRGIGLTATLAELIMERFDKRVRDIEGVYRYYRFADDVLVFSYTRSVHVSKAMEAILATFGGMSFSPQKSYDRTVCCRDKAKIKTKHIDYLGYKFSFDDLATARAEPREVRVTFSDRKLTRLKTRIVLAIRAHSKKSDQALLVSRLRFITSNYKVAQRRLTLSGGSVRIYSGVYFSYRYMGVYRGFGKHTPHHRQLAELDAFLHSQLWWSKSAFSPLIKGSAAHIIAQLKQLSFERGYSERMIARFSQKRIAEIKKAWNHAQG